MPRRALFCSRLTGRFEGDVVGQQVHHPGKAGCPLNQTLIVGRIVGIHQHGQVVEALDQHAALGVSGEAGWAAQRCCPFPCHVVRRRLQQGARRFRIVQDLEHAEETDVLVPIVVVTMVDEGGDGAHWLSIAPGDKIVALHVFPGSTARPVELEPLHGKQWRHPVGIVAIDDPGKRQKRFEICFAFDATYSQRVGHGALSPSVWVGRRVWRPILLRRATGAKSDPLPRQARGRCPGAAHDS